MQLRKLAAVAVSTTVIAATTMSAVSPAAAWCRWGRCGWGGPVVAGVVAGTVVGAAVAANARPYYVPGGYYAPRACPPGFHLGPYGRACWANR